jgi:hypothetical protein
MSSLLLVYMCIPVGYNYLENVEIPLTDFIPHLFLPIPNTKATSGMSVLSLCLNIRGLTKEKSVLLWLVLLSTSIV